jgi:hypothetical protein
LSQAGQRPVSDQTPPARQRLEAFTAHGAHTQVIRPARFGRESLTAEPSHAACRVETDRARARLAARHGQAQAAALAGTVEQLEQGRLREHITVPNQRELVREMPARAGDASGSAADLRLFNHLKAHRQPLDIAREYRGQMMHVHDRAHQTCAL